MKGKPRTTITIVKVKNLEKTKNPESFEKSMKWGKFLPFSKFFKKIFESFIYSSYYLLHNVSNSKKIQSDIFDQIPQ